MRVLLDTNVLLRMVEGKYADHETARAAVEALLVAGEEPVIVPQNLYEFWAVATRTRKVNGLEMPVPKVRGHVDDFRDVFPLLADDPGLPDEWLRLAARHAVAGVNSYDARLVAAMKLHGLTAILTFNGKDFRRYAGIDVLDPAAVAEGAG